MRYRLYIKSREEKIVPNAVVSFTLDGEVLATFPVKGGVFELDSEADSDLFYEGVNVEIRANGFYFYSTPLTNFVPYGAYTFIMTEKPSMIKPALVGIGLTMAFAYFYPVLKKEFRLTK